MSPRGIILTDSLTSQLIENVSIYRYAQQGVVMSALPLSMIGVSCLNLGSTAVCLGSRESQFPSVNGLGAGPASLCCYCGASK